MHDMLEHSSFWWIVFQTVVRSENTAVSAAPVVVAGGIRTRVHYVASAWDCRLRPYHVENTSSRLITEVKQRRAWLVLGWVTAWEYQVL